MSERGSQSGKITVLVVDDDREFVEMTTALLEAEGYLPIGAATTEEAFRVLSERVVQVLWVNWEARQFEAPQFVEAVRGSNCAVQIVLLVSHASEAPSRTLLRTLQVQGYCEKNEGASRLLLWTDVARKAAVSLMRLEESRSDLELVLQATARIHRHRDPAGLYEEILGWAGRLVPSVGSILGLFPDALGEDGDLVIEETTGTIARVTCGAGELAQARDFARALGREGLAAVRQALLDGNCRVESPWVVLPLRVGEHMLGFVALRVEKSCYIEAQTLGVFSHQASVAIQNALYYQMAALDPLTGVHARRFFEVWARREVRAVVRSGAPLGLLLLDMDGLKAINDRGGHRLGDQAIMGTGRVLREATREHDLAARLAGDEFAMLMPVTDEEGALAVARRVLELLSAGSVTVQGRSTALRASIGVAVLQCAGACPPSVGRALTPEFFEQVVTRLIRNADEALYAAKHLGGGCVRSGARVELAWDTGQGNLLTQQLA